MEDHKKQRYLQEVAIKSTKSYEKTITYIESLIDDPDFHKDVLKLRKKYKLPQTGATEYVYGDFKGEVYVKYPEIVEDTDLSDEIVKLCEKYGLDFMWAGIFAGYVLYNDTKFRGEGSPLEIIDLGHVMSDPEEDNADYFRAVSKTHPVAIFINPYSSQREIVDYIKKLYKISIAPIQNSHKDPKIKLGRVKKRKAGIRERNNFIYENRNLPYKSILKLLYDKYGKNVDMDEGYIGKIISIQKKIREEL